MHQVDLTKNLLVMFFSRRLATHKTSSRQCAASPALTQRLKKSLVDKIGCEQQQESTHVTNHYKSQN